MDGIDWTPERLKTGIAVKLKKVPFKVKLFTLVATNGGIDWFITNRLDDLCPRGYNLTVQAAQKANGVRWQIEQLHREIK